MPSVGSENAVFAADNPPNTVIENSLADRGYFDAHMRLRVLFLRSDPARSI